MTRDFRFLLSRGAFALLVVLVCASNVGCATMAGERTQTVKLVTMPPGRIVKFQGVNVRDGEFVQIKKDSNIAVFESVDPNSPELFPLKFKPSKWFIAGAILVVPAVVDIATGAWRNYENPQTVHLGDAPPPEPIQRQMTTEEDESFKKKTGGSSGSGSSTKKSSSSGTKKKSEPAPEMSPIEP